MSTRGTLILLTTAGMLAGANANAASFSTMPTIHTAPRLNLNVTPTVTPVVPITTDRPPPPPLAAPCSYHPAECRRWYGPMNDQFDTAGNLNPGGGGGGVKPGKKPNAQ